MSDELTDERRRSFGEWIQDKQNQFKPRRMTDAELARRIGLSRQHLGSIKKGESGTKKSVAISIGIALGVDPDIACNMAGFTSVNEEQPDLRFAREIEPILSKAGNFRPAVENMLKRNAEELVRLLQSRQAA